MRNEKAYLSVGTSEGVLLIFMRVLPEGAQPVVSVPGRAADLWVR